jgi:hypothetical protein
MDAVRIDGLSMQIVTRLNASLETTWQVWTEPGHIAQWWGPEGFTNTILQMDLRPGGEWKLIMVGPDGKRFPNKSEFLEIVDQQKIVFQHFNPDYLATILFAAEGEDTMLDWTMNFKSPELFDTVVKVFKADQGLAENIGKLKSYIETIKS